MTAIADETSGIEAIGTDRLVADQARRDALRFLALREVAHSKSERVPGQLLQEIDQAVAAPASISARLFRLPHMRQWCLTLQEFLAHNLDSSGVLERMTIHSLELRRLRLAAALADGNPENGTYELLVQPSSFIHLPGTGLALRFTSDRTEQVVGVRVHDCRIAHSDILRTQIGRAELWTSDLLVRRPGSRAYTFPREDDEQVSKWGERVDALERDVAAWWPDLGAEMPFLLQGIVSVDSPQAETHLSGTFGEVPGTLYLSWTEDRHILHEALVHEMFHTRLNYILDGRDVNVEGSWGYWAPWRYEVRPALAFVHGLYAHYGMALYNHRIACHLEGTPWRHKLATHLVRLAIARAQWDALSQPWGAEHLLTRLVSTLWSDVSDITLARSVELRDQLLTAIAGELGEIARAEREQTSQKLALVAPPVRESLDMLRSSLFE